MRITKKFLEENPEVVKKYGLIKAGGVAAPPYGIKIISRFLNWDRTRVQKSLERLGLIKEEVLDKEAVENMPTDGAARTFTSAVKSDCIGLVTLCFIRTKSAMPGEAGTVIVSRYRLALTDKGIERAKWLR